MLSVSATTSSGAHTASCHTDLSYPHYAHNTGWYQIKTRYNWRWSQSTIRLSELQVTKGSCIRTKQRVILREASHIQHSELEEQPDSLDIATNKFYMRPIRLVPISTNSLLTFLLIRMYAQTSHITVAQAVKTQQQDGYMAYQFYILEVQHFPL